MFDFELDLRATIVSGLFSLVFIIAMWTVPAWTSSATFTWQKRLIVTILLPVILYVIVNRQIN